jgi:hypothetical protein
MSAEEFRREAQEILGNARRLLLSMVEPLPGRAINRAQQELERKHGTPTAFAQAMAAAMPEVSIDGGVKAVERYLQRWQEVAPAHVYVRDREARCLRCGVTPSDRVAWLSGCPDAVAEEDRVSDREKQSDNTITYPLNPAEWAGVGMELLGQRKVELFRHLPTSTFLIQTRNGGNIQHMRLSAEALSVLLTLAFHVPATAYGELTHALRSNGDPSALLEAELSTENPSARPIFVMLGAVSGRLPEEEYGCEAGYACGGVRTEEETRPAEDGKALPEIEAEAGEHPER